ncbi:adhesin, partial [Bartonella bilalgolemii]
RIAENASNYLGGKADILKGIAPTYKIQNTDYGNIGAAFAGVDDSLSEIYKELSGVGSKSLVQQDNSEDGSSLITIGSKVGGEEISFANKDSKGRTLSGLNDGEVSKTSTAAITGKQLFETNTKLSSYLGGGASYNDGVWQKPTYSIQGTSHNNVGSAFSSVDTTLTQLKNNTTENLQNSLLWDEKEGAFVALHGENKKEKAANKLKFLIDGDIVEGSTEAITGNQLYKTNNKLAEYLGGEAKYNDGVWVKPTYSIQGTSHNNVGSAFSSVDTTLTQLKNNTIENLQNSLLWDEKEGAFVALHGENKKEKVANKLKFLIDGDIVEGSTEAITGNQLYKTNSKLAEYLGGKASYENGKWTAPIFKIKVLKEDGTLEDETYTNVAAALENVSSSFTMAVENNLVQQEKGENGSNRITIGSQVDGGEINFVNKDGEGRILSGLKDGEVSKMSTEAITGGQLYETKDKLAKYFGGDAGYVDGVWTAPTFQIIQLNSDSKSDGKKHKEYRTVAEAFGGVNDNMEDLNDRLNEVKKQTEQIEQNGLNWDEDKGAYDARRKDEKGNLATSTITGVKDGEISKGS